MGEVGGGRKKVRMFCKELDMLQRGEAVGALQGGMSKFAIKVMQFSCVVLALFLSRRRRNVLRHRL